MFGTTDPIKNVTEDHFRIVSPLNRFMEHLISNQFNGNLFAIYAHWGYGKTSAINLCKEIVSDEKFTQKTGKRILWVEPFCAYKYENIDNLLISLTWHIGNNFKQNKNIIESATKIGVSLLKIGLNISGSIVQSFLPGKYDNIGNDIFDGLSDADNLVFVRHNELSNIKENMNSLISEIKNSTRADLIIVPIDDIDRCKPEVAVNFIFSLKHLYETNDVLFLVTIDRPTILKYLIVLYGNTFDNQEADRFLEKIFSNWVFLPKPDLSKFIIGLANFNKEQLPEIYHNNLTTFTNLVIEKHIVDMSLSPRFYIRSYNFFIRYINYLYENEKEHATQVDEKELFIIFTTILFYINHAEQFGLFINNRGLYSQYNDLDNFVKICRMFLSKEHFDILGQNDDELNAYIKKLDINKMEDLGRVIPENILRCLADNKSGLRMFIEFTSHMPASLLNKHLIIFIERFI